MKRIVVILIGLVLAGCAGHNTGKISGSGTIEGTDINIGSQVSGPVLQVRVDEGSRVQRGDTLVVIDPTDYRLQLNEAVATMQSLESSYALAVEGPRREDILQAEAAYKSAEADYRRMSNLLATHTITQQQYDDSYARYVAAQQTYEKLKTGSRPAEIAAAKHRYQAAAAQADLLKEKVNDCFLLAPSSGTITLRSIEPGDLVSAGANLLRLTELDTVKLTIYLSEQNIGRIRLGDGASVFIDADPKKAHEGKVVYVSPTAEFTPKNVETKEERTKLVFGVKLAVSNADGSLKPGLPADADILVGENR